MLIYLLCFALVLLFLHGLGLFVSQFFIKKYEFLDVDGYTIHYQKAGNGHKKVILIHGMLANLQCWNQFLKFKDENTEYFAIDLPEMGESQSPNKKLKAPATNVEDIIYHFCQKLNLNNPVLVGSSLGGLVAYLTAIKYPDNFKKCVVIASPFNAKILILPIYKFSSISYFLNFLVNPIFIAIIHFRIARHRFSFQQVFSIMSKFRRFKHFKSSLEYTYLIQRVDKMTRIPTKVENFHFIWGDKDHVIKKSNFQNFIGANQKLDYQEIPNASHHPMESHPKEFSELLKKIIDQ